jgi:site-specific recombinase XerD
LVGSRRRRHEPYIFSPNDIGTLMTGAQGLRTSFASATHQTLIGLLAATGMRVGEAIRLDRGDLTEADAALMIRESKFGKSRMVPLQRRCWRMQRYAVCATTFTANLRP